LFFKTNEGANRGIGLELCKQFSQGGTYNTIYAICRKTSDDLTKLASTSNVKVQVLDGIQVTDSSAPLTIQAALKDIPIHLLVHNAGAYGPPDKFDEGASMDLYSSQTLTNITAERMRFAFELNTIAPLLITQALLSNLEQATDSKVIIISSAMGSIAENESGGHYAYRASKAAVNMVGTSLTKDLKDKNIAVSMSKCTTIKKGLVDRKYGFL